MPARILSRSFLYESRSKISSVIKTISYLSEMSLAVCDFRGRVSVIFRILFMLYFGRNFFISPIHWLSRLDGTMISVVLSAQCNVFERPGSAYASNTGFDGSFTVASRASVDTLMSCVAASRPMHVAVFPYPTGSHSMPPRTR